jgi:hypothetical protein
VYNNGNYGANNDPANKNNNSDNINAAMPSKVLLAAVAAPRTKPLTFSIDSTEKFAVTYYCEGNQDYAHVIFHINGTFCKRHYHVNVAQDGKSLLL